MSVLIEYLNTADNEYDKCVLQCNYLSKKKKKINKKIFNVKTVRRMLIIIVEVNRVSINNETRVNFFDKFIAVDALKRIDRVL
jgi:hypothetical protein